MIQIQKQSGFSLVETLVAITILLLVLVGPLTISTSTSKSTTFASEQVVAFFLAQEGLEIAQKARDDALLAGIAANNPNAWSNFTDTSNSGAYRLCFTNVGCGVELDPNNIGSVRDPVDCTAGGCLLYESVVSGVRAHYTHITSGGALASPYTRELFFTTFGPHEVKVVSRVTWRTGSIRAVQQVTLETYLFNVYE